MIAIFRTALMLCLLALPRDGGAQSGARFAFHYPYRQMVTVFAPAAAKPDWGQNLCVSVPCGELFEKRPLKPQEMLVLNAWWTPLPFGVYREGRLLAPDQPIRPGDRFVLNYADTAARTNSVTYGLAAYVFFAAPPLMPNGYGKLTPAQSAAALSPEDLQSDDKGLMDWSLPVSLKQPASRIQMDNLYSKRWKLFWQFAAAAPGERKAPAALRKGFPAWFDVPGFPILLNTFTDPGRQGFGHFDFDDIPRFPLLYLDCWRLTKDQNALSMARRGLEGILAYQEEDGRIPFDVYPWKNTVRHDANWMRWAVPHSMRAVARGIGVWKARDPDFDRRLDVAYRRFRRFVFAHRTNGLYYGSLWTNGFVMDAVWWRYQATKRAEDREDLRTLADAICRMTPADPKQRQEFGENLPITVIGLAKAYQALRDEKYLRAAEDWLKYPILPSLERNRRFWKGLPDFARAESGPDGVPNALVVWYNAEAMVEMFRATGDKKYLRLAAWVLEDYYDPRYPDSMKMVDTGDACTEHWNSNHAEDAMRSFSKYLWSLQYREQGIGNRE